MVKRNKTLIAVGKTTITKVKLNFTYKLLIEYSNVPKRQTLDKETSGNVPDMRHSLLIPENTFTAIHLDQSELIFKQN